MAESITNNKRIAKNTILLYMRTLFVMLITLYTSRVILQSLGVEDYGIYNVVGGVITMFTFISATLSTSSQRFITVELGKGDKGDMRKMFSICLTLHVMIALLIVALAEPIGIWFIYNKLLIPAERLSAALWVYQCTILSMVIMFLSVPYRALIVAYEHMNAFAYISIAEAAMKLLVAYAIMLCSSDKLIVYAILILLTHLIMQGCYMIYCFRRFPESRYTWYWDSKLVKKFGVFASWSIFGNMAFVSYTQGLNLLLGTFFMPTVNAARGIAVQVQSAVNNFLLSFQTAINPQITKNYAAGNLPEMIQLVFRSSRFSFYLLMILTIPIMIEAEMLLQLWLKTVPEYTVAFMRIILLTTWINSIANPLIISVKATGNVKRYECTVGGLMLAILPISYIFLRLGYPPVTVFVVHLCIECIAMLCRIMITRGLIQFSLKTYSMEVLLRITCVGIIAVLVPIILYLKMDASIIRFLVVCSASVLWSAMAVLAFGLTKGERTFLLNKAKAYIGR